MPLPEIFCWTRFGTEAGEPIGLILERKEAERRANGGLFYWGIGNSVAHGVTELIRICDRPEVLFSPMRSVPRRVDVAPGQVVVWTVAEPLLGERFEVPSTVRVTSRGRSLTRPHYALVCSSEDPLQMSDRGRLNLGSLRNLLSGKPLGASQVTAVVRRGDEVAAGSGSYTVAFRARLVKPYFVRLREPVVV